MKLYKLVSLISLGIGVISGPIIGLMFMPIETEIQLGSQAIAKVARDSLNHEIQYLTTGPTISWFGPSCVPNYSISEGSYGCIELRTDGKEGVIQLSIPKILLREIDEKKIGRVSSFPWVSLPFQVISSDSNFEIIRIQVPEGTINLSIYGVAFGQPFDFILISLQYSSIESAYFNFKYKYNFHYYFHYIFSM